MVKCIKHNNYYGITLDVAFNLNEICQLEGQEICIMLEDVNPIFKPHVTLRKKKEPWFKLKQ
jgi:hypothetical protein